jgi:DNA-binding transcriptional MerR regulator
LLIGELAKQTGISASRIRFYERRELLPKPSRGDNGYREYPAIAIKLLSLIDGAQRLGFSLTEIRDALSGSAPDFPSRAAMVEALRSKLASIDRHIREIRARRREIVKLLAEMRE